MKNIVRKLTSDQQKIVEDNHNLIYHFLHQRNLDIDEYYGIVAESLCKAVKSWDKSKANISSYFFQIARNDLYKHWRKEGAIKRGLDEIKVDIKGLELDTGYDLEESYILKESLLEIEKSEYSELFKLRLDGYSQNEIADILGVSRSTVHRRLREVGEIYFGKD